MTRAASDIPHDAWEILSPYMTETRKHRMLAATAKRTRYVRLVIQDIHNPHNVAACMRSAEAFGVQNVDIVTLRPSKFRPSNASRGVAHWLTVKKHESVKECADALRKAGYLLAAGIPKPHASSLYDLPLDQPIAVIFGNEHDGIDLGWHQEIDLPFTIPMVGMVESLNISVCAAVTLAQLTHAARLQVPEHVFHLSEPEKKALLNDWVCRHVAQWQDIIQRHRAGPPSSHEAADL